MNSTAAACTIIKISPDYAVIDTDRGLIIGNLATRVVAVTDR